MWVWVRGGGAEGLEGGRGALTESAASSKERGGGGEGEREGEGEGEGE